MKMKTLWIRFVLIANLIQMRQRKVAVPAEKGDLEEPKSRNQTRLAPHAKKSPGEWEGS
jgi:hypothetical protein